MFFYTITDAWSESLPSIKDYEQSVKTQLNDAHHRCFAEKHRKKQKVDMNIDFSDI